MGGRGAGKLSAAAVNRVTGATPENVTFVVADEIAQRFRSRNGVTPQIAVPAVQPDGARLGEVATAITSAGCLP